jgi:hypothetical protein
MPGHFTSGTSRSIRSAMVSMRAGVRWVSAQPLTSIAGPWSGIPVQEVLSMLTRPSARVSPGVAPSLSQSCAMSASFPSMRSTMLSLNSTS